MKQIYLLLVLLSVVGHDAAFSQCSLPAPANLEVKMSAESATLTWTNSSAVAYYKVRHRKTGDALWITSAQLTTTSYTITGLTPGISYDIRVVPYCTNNQQGLFAFKVDTTLIPNIILIYLDDAPNGLTNTTGAPSFVQTPNIHKIFKKGMDFPLNSCIISLCAPSRAVMITGHTPAQTGVIDNSTQANFNMSLPTLGERLKEKGVYTAALGKFHDVIGIHGADDWSYRYESVTSQSAATVKFSRNGGPWKKAGTDSIITKVLTDTAIALIQNTAQPLFLLLAVRDPHTPTKVPAPFNHYYDNEVITLGANTAPYTDLYPSFLYDLPNKNYKEEQAMIATLKDEYRALAYVDDRIGAIISALKTTGKLENTMIIFTSDNGLMNSEHGIYGKRHPYKESVNVPLHIWYEEWFTPGSSNLLTSNIDLYATILDAVGIEDHTSAGYSIKEMYDGIATRATAYSSVSYTIEDNYQDLASSKTVWDESYKLIQFGCSNITESFFDLKKDPDEMSNLINKAELQSTIQLYRVKLSGLAAQYDDVLQGVILNCNLVDNPREAADVYDNTSFGVYPNPTSGWVHIEGLAEGAEKEVELLSAVGNHMGYVTASFDTKGLPDGLYFLKTQDANGVIKIASFIRQH